MKGVLIACGVVLAMTGFAGMLFAEGEAATVAGTVLAASKDGSGAVTDVVIDTPGDSYAVAKNAKGNELLGLENRKVEVTGTVDKDEFSNRVISVTSFRLIP